MYLFGILFSSTFFLLSRLFLEQFRFTRKLSRKYKVSTLCSLHAQPSPLSIYTFYFLFFPTTLWFSFLWPKLLSYRFSLASKIIPTSLTCHCLLSYSLCSCGLIPFFFLNPCNVILVLRVRSDKGIYLIVLAYKIVCIY